MNLQKVTSDYRMSQWAKIIKERQDSGKKVDEFCKERGFSRNVFYYWQRKLRKVACTEIARISDPNEPIKCAPNGWVQLSSPEQEKETINVEVSGCYVCVDNNTDPELLKKVCRILKVL